MSVQDWFDRLGAALEVAWSAADRDEEAFPAIAAEVLAKDPAEASFDRDAFVREQLDPTRPARRQLAPLGTFGQPSFTVFHGHGFLIDVYFWRNSLSAIHNHPFCGLFTILDGWSVHAVYAHEERERVGPRLSLGAIRQTELEVLERGATRLFSLREHPLVHALIHVPVGAVSMVIRTARTVGYLRYFPPSLALSLERQDDLGARPIELLETLRHAHDPSFGEHLVRFLDIADLESSFISLTRLWLDLGAADQAALIERLRARHGARAEGLPEVMERSRRWLAGDALRERLFDQEDRFVATALMLAETREAALRLLEARYEDPQARLHTFIDHVAPFEPDDPAAPVLAHALVDGLDAAAAEARLVEAFGADNVEPGQRDVIEQHQRSSIFAALGAR
ncbi:MAG: hypothetical protein H6719_08180 [Sandaracinaceae bacterium]|nr:hypothetical protein [Sandaracinaceae bacterium]